MLSYNIKMILPGQYMNLFFLQSYTLRASPEGTAKGISVRTVLIQRAHLFEKQDLLFFF